MGNEKVMEVLRAVVDRLKTAEQRLEMLENQQVEAPQNTGTDELLERRYAQGKSRNPQPRGLSVQQIAKVLALHYKLGWTVKQIAELDISAIHKLYAVCRWEYSFVQDFIRYHNLEDYYNEVADEYSTYSLTGE